MIPADVLFAIALVLACGTGVTALVTPWIDRFGHRMGWVDVPRSPKQIHKRPMVRMGGAAIYLGLVVALVVAEYTPLLQDWRLDPKEPYRVAGLLAGVTLAVIMGLVDDIRPLGPLGQLGGQVLAAAIAIIAGIETVDLNIPFIADPLFTLPPIIAVLFTLFWFVGMMNTINWIDGLDGLAAGVTLIAAGILFLRTTHLIIPQYSIALLMVALMAAVLGFLPYNFYPARIFMGSTGAYTIGFALAALSIIGGAKVATALLVLWLPIIDAAWVIFRRLRAGRNPMRGGDPEHLHRRLMLLGLSHRTIVLLYYGITLLLGVIAFILTGIPKLYALVGIGVVFGAALALLAWITRAATLPANTVEDKEKLSHGS